MAIGEAVRKVNATVIAVEYCHSSCANYVLAGATRRIVMPQTTLAFHGGVARPDKDRIAKSLAESGYTDPKLVDNSFAYETSSRARQDRFLATVGINPDFFDWMDRWNGLSGEQQTIICNSEAKAWVFSLGLLNQLGYRIDVYHGPENKESLKQVLALRGRSKNSMCYVSDRHWRLWPIAPSVRSDRQRREPKASASKGSKA